MIVYERPNHFIMIEQHHHAMLSGEFAKNWRDDLFVGLKRKEDVVFAVARHDLAWIGLDAVPLWNDEAKRPYSFFDLPSPLKLPHYQQAIDHLEGINEYAAYICSQHYSSFFEESTDAYEHGYLMTELNRQQRLRLRLRNVADEETRFHLQMLKFLDRLSIYICINEPGLQKDDEFAPYRDGFPHSNRFDFSSGEKIVATWLDKQCIELSKFPFTHEFEVSVPVKLIDKKSILESGIAHAYRNAVAVDRTVRLVSKS